MNSGNDFLSERYSSLWNTAFPAICSGAVEMDSVLAAAKPDLRRGLTLIAQPSEETANRVLEFLDRLRELDPAQYYYPRTSLHLTVLSLFTGTTEHKRFAAKTSFYLEAVEAALADANSFAIDFKGVTVSPGAIMIQGFPHGAALEMLRDGLRASLQNAGLAEGLDVRYRLITAHLTACRFRSPLRDSVRFAETLQEFRQTSFGSSIIKVLKLVKSDWYISPETTEILGEYSLPEEQAR